MGDGCCKEQAGAACADAETDAMPCGGAVDVEITGGVDADAAVPAE
jgi:hypothetical protein